MPSYPKIHPSIANRPSCPSLNSTLNWARVNLGHAAFGGNYNEAKQVYEKYLKNETDSVEAQKSLLQDLTTFETAVAIDKERKNEVEQAKYFVRTWKISKK